MRHPKQPTCTLSPAVALALLLASSCCAELVSFRPPPLHKCNASGPAKQPDPRADNSELLDIVLLASVDGKFHALNRTTGHTLWSMSSFSSSSSTTVSPPSSLAPLVRTPHIDQDLDLTDGYLDACQEMYIIEPQSGDIYVAATPSSPLRRFPYSIPRALEVVVELETGAVRFGGADTDTCPWGPSPTLDARHRRRGAGRWWSAGLVYYYITIHTRPSDKRKLVPAQTLAFSTYGPSSRDNVLQGSYRSTKDGVYMESLPNGELLAFKTGSREDPGVLWGREFKSPIVAIFDVLRSPAQDTVFILLQPRPQLYTILPNLVQTTSMDQLRHLDSVYVRLVEATGSLFAMSPDRFPLVAFSGAGRGRGKLETAGGEPKQRLYGSEDEDGAERCLDRSSWRCLVGMHPLEGGDGDGPEYRLKRLIDGVPGVVREDHK
ncbi:hypothetical protein B0H14DRAFT_3892649 [Mycena olivaceomarginata]|nr:hypothetical protein B0H14DRAFT_3892649 [Mycena olivaceomarginata]